MQIVCHRFFRDCTVVGRGKHSPLFKMGSHASMPVDEDFQAISSNYKDKCKDSWNRLTCLLPIALCTSAHGFWMNAVDHYVKIRETYDETDVSWIWVSTLSPCIVLSSGRKKNDGNHSVIVKFRCCKDLCEGDNVCDSSKKQRLPTVSMYSSY